MSKQLLLLLVFVVNVEATIFVALAVFDTNVVATLAIAFGIDTEPEIIVIFRLCFIYRIKKKVRMKFAIFFL